MKYTFLLDKSKFVKLTYFVIVLSCFFNLGYANQGIISLDKESYVIGDTVIITIIELREDINIEIMSPSNLYRYLGIPENELKFIPKDIGDYEIRVKDSQDNLLQIITFSVIDLDSSSDENMTLNRVSRFKITNSKNQLLSADVIVYDTQNNYVGSVDTFDPILIQGLRYNVELALNRDSVTKIKFNNLRFQGNVNLGFEELPTDFVNMFWKNTKKVYAIDPTYLNFDNATVTAVAKGHELYKCKEYNFTSQICYGTYEKIMDLTPGQEYDFTLTPEDPLYTEQTSQTQNCTCSNTCETTPGASSQCTATCTDYCDINFTVPVGAISGWLEKVHYNVTISLSTTGTPVSGSHQGRIDKDETPNNGNDVQIGISTVITEGDNIVIFTNNNMVDSGSLSFDDDACSTWEDGYCTWKPYLSTQYVCQGSNKICTTIISLTLINYTWNYSQDTTPPTIVLGRPVNNSYIAISTNTFYYTPDDDLALQNCSIYINNVLNQTNSSLTKGVQTIFKVNNMQDGQYSWYITCYDTAENSKTSGTKYLNVDTTIPSVYFVYPTPDNDTYLQVNYFNINVSHTESNPDTLILYWNNTVESQSYSGTYTNISRTGLSDGTYNYYVIVNDTAENTNQTETRVITIDTQNPVVNLNEPLNNNWITYNMVQFNYTPTDANLENCSLWGNFSGNFELNQTNTTPVSGVKNKFTPIPLSEGFYKWNVQCYDKSGRMSFATQNYTLKIDKRPPVVTLQEPVNNTYWNLTSTIVFNYTVTDNFNVITNCSFEAISNTSTEYYEDYTVQTGVKQNFTVTLANNIYNWTIRCTDPAGNTKFPGYYNLTVNIAEDTVGPTVTLNSPQNNNWTNINNVTLIYTPTDQSLIHDCSLYLNNQYNQTDYSVENAVQNNFTLYNITEKIYTWFINCTDNSTNNNTGKSSTRTFTVDQTPPTPNLVYPGNYFNTTLDYINFTWIAIDNLANQMYCDLVVNNTVESDDQLTNNNTNTNYTVNFVIDGIYYWNLTCRDLAYNYQTSETRTFTIDTTSPLVDLISPEDNNVSLTGNITFYFKPSDNSSALNNCSLYINSMLNQSKNLSLLINNQQNNFTVDNIVSGNYIWQVNCTDNFGNLGNSTVRNFIVDTLSPKTNVPS